MNIKLRSLFGAAISLLVMLGADTASAQSADTRIVYSADVTDRKTRQTSHQIFSMDENGGSMVQLTSGGGAFPAWSFDKRYVLFHRATAVESTIYVMEAAGERNGGRTFPVMRGGGDSGVEWSPDGQLIVFTGTAGITDGLWTVAVNADTGEVGIPTLVRAGVAAAPAWSPDGTKIAFVSYPGAVIRILDLATGAETFGVSGYAPSFSPDGSKIAYSAAGPVTVTSKGKTTTTWSQQIYVAEINGVVRTQVTALNDYNNFPRWSVDGAQIAFWNQVNGSNSIFKLTLDTGIVTVVNRGGRTLDWAP
jgi:Tol biopolymer transport system component